MSRLFWVAFSTMLLLGVGLAISCGDDDDDDDNDALDDVADDDNDDNDDNDYDIDDDDTCNGITGDVWTDPASGLTWQTRPAESDLEWEAAIGDCQASTVDGGDWRLPTVSELRTLIRGCPETEPGGACGVTDSCLELECCNDACSACDPSNYPDKGCFAPEELPYECETYWSSSEFTDIAEFAWIVIFGSGIVTGTDKESKAPVRCVRD
jgi:hypothetical protein